MHRHKMGSNNRCQFRKSGEWPLNSTFRFLRSQSDIQIIFELSVLFLTIFNALSRPRASTSPLILVLYRDSILFFLVSGRNHRAIVLLWILTAGLGYHVISCDESHFRDRLQTCYRRYPTNVRASSPYLVIPCSI